MNSKERVTAALEPREPDRIPWGEFAVDHDTVARIIGHETFLRAKAASQIAFWEGRRDEVVQSWREDTIELHSKLPVFDIVNLAVSCGGLAPPKGYEPEAPEKIEDGAWRYPDGRVLKHSEVTGDITCVEDPDRWTREFRAEDYEGEVNVEPPDPSVFEVVDAVIDALGDEKYIIGPSGGEVGMVLLGGMERGLTEFITNPEAVKAAARRGLAYANASDQHLIRPAQQAVMWGQDYSYKSGPLISPGMFREFALPALAERARRVHERGLKVCKHCCGNNWQLLDMFVEIGFDCYQSIQPTAEMDLAEVKSRYGDRIALWGGVPVEALVSGTTDEVAEEVRRACEVGGPGGGYIFGSSHSIAVGTKYDNFMTMVDEFEKHRDL